MRSPFGPASSVVKNVGAAALGGVVRTLLAKRKKKPAASKPQAMAGM